jgi:hypothetical protein
MRTVKHRLVTLAPLAFGVLLVAHFSATLVHLMPMNPIKMALAPVVDRYMSPTFAQRWELFAPDPIIDTKRLLVSCRVRRGDATTETAWADITTPVRALKYRFRLSPADRLERVQTASLHLAFAPDDAVLLRMKRQKEVRDAYAQLIASFDDRKRQQLELAKTLLGRVASVECDRWYGSGATVAVRVRMLAIDPPPFSQRWLSNEAGAVHYFDFDWRDYERVAPI